MLYYLMDGGMRWVSKIHNGHNKGNRKNNFLNFYFEDFIVFVPSIHLLP